MTKNPTTAKTTERILLTGADGMLGNNITRELVDRGYAVNCFIESSHDGATLKDLPVDIIKGDLLNAADLERAFEGCSYVIHTAGITSLWPARQELSKRVNVEAVKMLVAQAKNSGIKRFIHIGTATSFGHGPIDNPGTEKGPYTNHVFKLDYQDTKYEAQKYLVQEHKDNAFPVIVLNPTFMMGKYDSGNGSNKMVLMIHKQKVPGYSPGGKNYVNVKDVAVAAANALTMGTLGECYITGNKNMSYKDAFAFIAATLEVKAPKMKLPRFLALAFGALSSAVAAITKKTPSVTYRMTRIGCEGCYYSSEKAVRELKMPQTPIEDGIRDSLDWFKEMGMV